MKLDKEKIKRYSKIAQYCVIALCWLMALVGISAYAVYWCRANFDYEQSSNNDLRLDTIKDLDAVKRNAIENNNSRYYSLKSKSFVSTDLSVSANTNDFDDYISVYAHTQPWSTSVYYYARYDGNFYYYDIDTQNQYKTMSFAFSYDGSDTIHLSYIWLQGYNNSDLYLYRDNDRNYSPITLLVTDYSFVGSGDVGQVYNGSIIEYYFSVAFDMSKSTPFEFKKDYNFNSLVSENITGDTNVIQPYKLGFNGDPLDEVILAYVKMDFVSNNYLYKGIYLEFRKPYLVRYNGQDLQVNFYGSTSQLIVSRVFYLRSIPNTVSVYPSADTMDLVAVRHNYGDKLAEISQGNEQRVIVYGTDYTFTNDAYRLIYINDTDYNSQYDVHTMPLLNSLDNYLYNPYLYRGLALYQVLNNGYLTYDLGTLTYDLGDSHFGDVFTLYTQAFTGLMPILNIQILPSFTLGMLLFIPLVITIIIVILRLVKK